MLVSFHDVRDVSFFSFASALCSRHRATATVPQLPIVLAHSDVQFDARRLVNEHWKEIYDESVSLYLFRLVCRVVSVQIPRSDESVVVHPLLVGRHDIGIAPIRRRPIEHVERRRAK